MRLTYVTTMALIGATSLNANGIFRTGYDAQSMGRAGIDIVSTNTPTAAMTSNPAGLAGQASAIQATAVVTGVEGSFSNAFNSGSSIRNPLTAFPTGAIAWQLKDMPEVTLGISLAPDAVARGYWEYNDPTYGFQSHDSRLITARLAFATGWQVTDDLAIGGMVGVTYNENYLKAPYTFQNAGLVTGAKVLLDLETTGFGPSFSLGAEYDVTDWASIGVRYISPTWLFTEGNADGFAGFAPLSYTAQIDQQLPQRIGIGVKVEPLDWLSIMFQADWVDYGSAFDTLEIKLGNGAQPALPNTFTERSPLNWESVWVLAVAAQVDITEDLTWDVGYSYGWNPVPDSTLTPLTAAIFEQTVSTGLSYRWNDVEIALAYQYEIPHSQTTTSCILLNGEYQNSTVEVGAHTGAVSLTWYF